MTKRPPKTKPIVLRVLALLGLTDSDVGRLLQHTPQTVGDWTHGRRPIPPVTHAAMWFVVARMSGFVGPGDQPLAPRGVLQLDQADEAAKVFSDAARAALANVDEATISAGIDLGKTMLERLAEQARTELATVHAAAKRLASVRDK